MSSLKIVCPHCQERLKLKVDVDTEMLIMNCPACNSALMYYFGQTYEVDSVEMTDYSSKKMKKSKAALNKENEISESITEEAILLESEKMNPEHELGEAVREDYIKKDDIVNLRIELERGEDCLDFIKSL